MKHTLLKTLHSPRKQLILSVLFGLMISFWASAALGHLQTQLAAPQPIIVERFGPVESAIAPGLNLNLVRYEIPADRELPVHFHEGAQIGWVQSGMLDYSVVDGEVGVFELDEEGQQQQLQTLHSGDSATIKPGQWVVEINNVVHQGRSGSTDPLIIFTATLLRDNAPLATIVDADDSP